MRPLRYWPWATIALETLGCSGDGNDLNARGVAIRQVAIYQGVERVLMTEGTRASSTVPLIAGRDALLRVFYEASEVDEGTVIVGRLVLGNRETVEVSSVAASVSTDANLASTVNFPVQGDSIADPFDYSVTLSRMEGAAGEPTAKPDDRWPAQGLDSVSVEGAPSVLRVMLVPFAYHADGSGRVPDLSDEQLERYRTRLLGVYPVSAVELTVHDTVVWNEPVGEGDEGWQKIGAELYELRKRNQPPDDVYYYGVFDPADSLEDYCSGSCLGGADRVER